MVVPYRRGDLVARAHAEGEVLRAEHAADGTLLEARVPPGLAAQLEAAALTAATAPGRSGTPASGRLCPSPSVIVVTFGGYFLAD